MRMPHAGYVLRACIAQRPAMLEKIEITGLGGVRRARCLRCGVQFKPICDGCKEIKPKPVKSEIVPVRVESEVKQ
jgi:hypothetical protein